MKKAVHYIKCLMGITKKLIFSTYRICKYSINACIGIISCNYKVFFNKALPQKTEEHLETFEILTETKPNWHTGVLNPERCELSIIIPLYNVSAYIEECLNSIVTQKTKYSFEIILIDDGSTDDTCDIVRRYLNDTKIRLYNQKNAGQSAARNNAIEKSFGKYIMFVDGDDVLLPGAIEKLMNEAVSSNADIVEGEIVNFYNIISDEMLDESRKKYRVESNDENPFFVLTTYGYSVAKVYRRLMWEKIRFPEGYIFEDTITKYILRRKANKVVFIGDVVYGYRRNTASSSHGTNQLKKLDSIRVFPKIVELCKKTGAPFDDVFYYLALNHIGILNYITVRVQDNNVQKACFSTIQKQLLEIEQYKPEKLPVMFSLLRKSILECDLTTWKYVAETIIKYNLLKKWREIN